MIALEENMIVEGSAGLVLAGYNRVKEAVAGERSVLVLCGANVGKDFVAREIFGLR